MAQLSFDSTQSIAKMNTRQLGELFVETCRLEKIRNIVVPCSATKSLDAEIKRMINWKINQKYASIINFGNLNEHIIRLMVYAQKYASNKSTSKQESSKANIIEQTVMNNINNLMQKLDEMKLNDNHTADAVATIDKIEEDLEIERNILKTLQKKIEGGEKKNMLEDTQKVKTLAKTVYKILLEDTPKAERLYREIDIFSRPVRDATQDTGGNYRLANSERDRRFKASDINPKADRTSTTNWRNDSSKTMTFSDKPKNSSTYRPKLQDNDTKQFNTSKPNGSIYQPPLTGKKHYGNDTEFIENPDTRCKSSTPSGNTYVPPHMRNAYNGSGHDSKQNGRGDGVADFINFDDLQKKKGFNIEQNDFPELGGVKKKQSIESALQTSEQEIATISKPDGRFGVLATADDSDDGVDWEDEPETPSQSIPTIQAIKAPSIWGNSKSFVEIAKEAEETCRIRKEAAERLKQEELERLVEEKKRNESVHVHKPYSIKNKHTSNTFEDDGFNRDSLEDYQNYYEEPVYEEPVHESEYYEDDEDW